MTTSLSIPTPTPRRRRIGWRGLLLAALALLSILALIALVPYVLWRSRPAFWTQAQAQILTTDPQQIDAQLDLAVDAEQRFLAGLYGQPGRYDLSFTEEQINAWLARRLPDWIKHGYTSTPPLLEHLGPPVVQLHEDRLLLALAYNHPQWNQVFTADIRLIQRQDGQVVAQVNRILGGNLSIPVGPLLEGLQHLLDQEGLEIWPPISALRHGTPLDPRYPARGWEDGRRWNLSGFKLRSKKVDFTLEVQDQHP